MDLSLRTLREALTVRRQIENLERRLASLFGGEHQTLTSRRRRPMSAATRAKLAAAARRRWAQTRSTSGRPVGKSGKKAALSTAGRRMLADAMKARWAARRATASSLYGDPLYGDPTTDPRPPAKKKK